MTVFITHRAQSLFIRAGIRDERMIGDIHRELNPGDSFYGHNYETVRGWGQGRCDFEPTQEWNDAHQVRTAV